MSGAGAGWGGGEVHRLTVRLPAALVEALGDYAERDRRSLNGELVVLLEEALAARSALGPLVATRVGPRAYERGGAHSGVTVEEAIADATRDRDSQWT